MKQTIAKKEILPGQSKVALFYLALVLAALIWFTPVITLILTALKDAGDFARNGAFSFPKSIRWANFSEAWDTGVKNYFWNSVIVTGFKVPIGIIIESLAAFALTHMHFKWADRVFTYILIGLTWGSLAWKGGGTLFVAKSRFATTSINTAILSA